MIRICTDE